MMLKEQERLDKLVNDFLEHGGDTPEHLKTVLETNPNKQPCSFFEKTSTCRFFDVCSRNHRRPGISRTILIPNFFSHYSLEKTENEHNTDTGLEFEHSETNEAYREFFFDILPEFEKHGKVTYLKTCCNREAHLRGNVFVEFGTTRAALKCYRELNGRWYAGKQLSVEFCNILSWKSAICGLYFSKRCPKGDACNFLHVFNNPKKLYTYQFNDVSNVNGSSSRRKRQHSFSSSVNSRNWRWSESPERFSLVENDVKKEKSERSRGRRSASRKNNKKRTRSRSSSRRKRTRSRSSRRKRSRSRSSSRRSTRRSRS